MYLTRFDTPWEGRDFAPGSGLNGPHAMGSTLAHLLKAAITSGRAPATRLRLPSQGEVYRVMEVVGSILSSYHTGSGELAVTADFTRREWSEKRTVTERIGMAMTALWADQVAWAPWMLHVSRFEQVLGITCGPTKHRPDLLGLHLPGVGLPAAGVRTRAALAGATTPSAEWLVAEAKGRSRYSGRALTKAKAQVRNVRTIGGTAPWLSVAVLAHHARDSVRVVVQDPEPDPEGYDWQVSPAQHLAAYYAPILTLQAELGSDDIGDGYERVTIPMADVELQLKSETLERARHLTDVVTGQPSSADDLASTVDAFFADARECQDAGRSLDGIDAWIYE